MYSSSLARFFTLALALSAAASPVMARYTFIRQMSPISKKVMLLARGRKGTGGFQESTRKWRCCSSESQDALLYHSPLKIFADSTCTYGASLFTRGTLTYGQAGNGAATAPATGASKGSTAGGDLQASLTFTSVGSWRGDIIPQSGRSRDSVAQTNGSDMAMDDI
ncbi:hypothetical protein C8R44DRAFT_738770 [Mycena epipterygia]|nr:hypothetical protein C8R44DRAFT_738770 [Mycena epipterygia]